MLDTSKLGRRIVSKGILVIQNISKFDAGKKREGTKICILFLGEKWKHI